MLRWGPRAAVAYPWLLSATATRLVEQRNTAKYYAQRLGISICLSGLYLVYWTENAFSSSIQHVRAGAYTAAREPRVVEAARS